MIDSEYTRKLLSEGEKFVEYRDEVVLVIGNSGSGKSALVQYIATDLSRLKIVNYPIRIISTDEQIRSSPNFPSLFEYKGHNFYDCPGFDDTRDKPHALASGHFIKKLLDQAKKVKFILVVEYSSITDEHNVDFKRLLEHLSVLVKDFSKFSYSTILVATKVDLCQWFYEKDIPIHTYIESISQKLMKIKNYLESADTFFQGNRSNAVGLLSCLIQPKRLLLFYQPNDEKKIDFAHRWLINSKILLENAILTASYTSPLSAADFPSPHRKTIIQLAEKSISIIINQITNIRDSLLMQCDMQSIHSLRELGELKSRIQHKIDLLNNSKSDTIKNGRMDKIVCELNNGLRKLNVKESSKGLGVIEKQIDVLRLLQAFKNNDIDIDPSKWLSEITGSLSVTPELNTWDKFLPYLYLELSNYEVLKNQQLNNVDFISGETDTDDMEENVIEFFEKLTETILSETQELPDPYLIRVATLNQLNNILSLTVRQKVALQPVNGVITVKQNIIILSDVVEALNEAANSGMNLKLFATDTIFIDCSLEKQSHDITLIAPCIKLIAKQKIAFQQPDSNTLLPCEGDGTNTEGVNRGCNLLAITMSPTKRLALDLYGAGVDNHQSSYENVITRSPSNIDESKVTSDVSRYKLNLLAMKEDSFFLRLSDTFLNQVFLTEKLDHLYKQHDFFNEMMMFENEYHRLRGPPNFVDLYMDLLHRVARYSSRVNQDAQLITDIGKKSLQVLYTAILARVCNFKRHSQHTLIEDQAQYIESTITQLKNFKDNNYSKSLCMDLKNYSDLVKRRIIQVETSINMKLFNESNNLIEQDKISLINSIKDSNRKGDWTNVGWKFFYEMDTINLYTNVMYIALITLLCLSYCKQANKTIQENLSNDKCSLKSDEKATDIAEVHDETDFFNVAKEELKKSANKRLNSLEKLILDMEREIYEYKQTFNSRVVLPSDQPERFEGFNYTLSNLLISVRGAKASLAADHNVVPTHDVLVDIESTLNQVEEAINQAIETEAEDLEERYKSYKSVKNQNEKDKETKERNLLQMLKQLIQIFESYTDVYADDEIGRCKKNLKTESRLKRDRKIRQTLISMLLNMEDMTKTKSTLQEKPQMMLGVSTRELPSKMKELREVLENLCARYQGEKFNSLVSPFNDSMTTMIEVCECVENCENLAELAANIALMNGNGFGFEKPGEELTPSIQHMHLVIQSSIVLDRFKSCVEALDGSQSGLTGSSSALLYFDLQKESKPKQDIQALIKEAMDKISDFTVKIKN